MFIDLNTIAPEGIRFDRTVRLSGLEGPSREPIPDLDAHLAGTVSPAPGGGMLAARLTVTVPLACSRCLDSFSWPVDAGFTWKVLRREPDDNAPASADEDDASILVAPEGKIDLTEIASEQVYLNLPLKPVCSAGCKGLCPACGANRNLSACGCVTGDVDPRLAPLLTFKQKLQGS